MCVCVCVCVCADIGHTLSINIAKYIIINSLYIYREREGERVRERQNDR